MWTNLPFSKHGLGIWCGWNFSAIYFLRYVWHELQLFTMSVRSWLMRGQHINSLALHLHFSMPMWPLCIFSSMFQHIWCWCWDDDFSSLKQHAVCLRQFFTCAPVVANGNWTIICSSRCASLHWLLCLVSVEFHCVLLLGQFLSSCWRTHVCQYFWHMLEYYLLWSCLSLHEDIQPLKVFQQFTWT